MAREPRQADEPLRELTEAERDSVPVHARRLRDDPGFIAAVESAKEHIMKELFETAQGDMAAREALYHERRALDRLVRRMDSLGSVRKPSTAYRSVA